MIIYFYNAFFNDIGLGITTGALFIAILTLLYQWCQPYLAKDKLDSQFGREAYTIDQIKYATKNYIKPYFSMIDPAVEGEKRRLYTTREGLFEGVTRFIKHEYPGRHLLILADSGMGKSSFCINYYIYNQKKLFDKQRIAIIPLGTNSVAQDISRITDQNETTIFLDALDEDVAAIENHRARLHELMDLCWRFRRVIITCRTQFFPKDEEIPKEVGVLKIGPRDLGDSQTQELWKMYLLPFEQEEISKYLHKRYSIFQIKQRNRAIHIIKSIPLLVPRPMILAHVPDLLLDTSLPIAPTITFLYSIMIKKWAMRESSWIEPKSLLDISVLLAADIYENRKKRGGEFITRDDLKKFCDKNSCKIPEWKLTGRSLLNRDADGNLKFAHRSFLEFLFVSALLTGRSVFVDELTDMMKTFLKSGIEDIEDIQKLDLTLWKYLVKANNYLIVKGTTKIVLPDSIIDVNLIIRNDECLCFSIVNFKNNEQISISPELLNMHKLLGQTWESSGHGAFFDGNEDDDLFKQVASVHTDKNSIVGVAYAKIQLYPYS